MFPRKYFKIKFREHTSRLERSISLRECLAIPFVFVQLYFTCLYLSLERYDFIEKSSIKTKSHVKIQYKLEFKEYCDLLLYYI